MNPWLAAAAIIAVAGLIAAAVALAASWLTARLEDVSHIYD